MKMKRDKNFMYYTEKNNFGPSLDYEVVPVNDTIPRSFKLVKIYDYDSFIGKRVPTTSNYWRLDFYDLFGISKSSFVGSFSECMTKGKSYIKFGF